MDDFTFRADRDEIGSFVADFWQNDVLIPPLPTSPRPACPATIQASARMPAAIGQARSSACLLRPVGLIWLGLWRDCRRRGLVTSVDSAIRVQPTEEVVAVVGEDNGPETEDQDDRAALSRASRASERVCR